MRSLPKLYPFQEKNLDTIRKFKGVVLNADEVGLGKTVQTLWFFNETSDAKPGLVICPANLRINWQREAKKLFGIKSKILEGKPYKILGSVPLYIISYDICKKWSKQLRRFDFKTVIIDEAQYIANLNSARCKATILVSVKRKYKHVLSGTPITNRHWDLYPMLHILDPRRWNSPFTYGMEFCCTPDAPIWMGDFSFKLLDNIKVGDEVIGWLRDNQRANKHRKQRGDLNFQQRRLVRTKVTHVRHRISPIVKITMTSGRVIRCTADHKWLSGSSIQSSKDHFTCTKNPNAILQGYLKVGDILCNVVDPDFGPPPELERIAGWVGGIYDGEGTWPQIAQTRDVNPLVCDRIEEYMTKLGFEIVYAKSKDRYIVQGGRREAIRFVNWCKPIKQERIGHYILGSKFIEKDTIAKIEKEPSGRVVSLTTETGNYVAWGFCSKNCDVEEIKGEITFKEAANHQKLHKILKENYLVRNLKEDVLKDLPKLRKIILPMEIPRREYELAERDFLRWLASYDLAAANRAARNKRLTRFGYLKRLAVKLKLKACFEWIKNIIENSGQKLIIGAIHRKTWPHTISTLESMFPTSVAIHGGKTRKQKQEAVDRFQNDPNCPAITLQLKSGGMGLNLQGSRRIMCLLEIPWTPTDVSQFIGRGHRIGSLDPVSCYFMLAEHTIEETLCKIIQRKSKISVSTIDGGNSPNSLNLLDMLHLEMLKNKNKGKKS